MHTLTPTLQPVMGPPILCRDTLHTVYLNLYVVPARKSIGHTVDYLLVHLGAVDGQSGGRVELLVADMTLEVFCLLMINEDLLIIELTVAVPGHSMSGSF